MKTLSYAAIVAALAFGAPALAQPATPETAAVSPPATTSSQPDTPSVGAVTTPSVTAPGAPVNPEADVESAASAAASGTNASVVTGMSVKDSSGAIIGEVTGVKPDAAGKNLATIKMGDKAFSVEASSLAVADGAATLNATRADIDGMLKK